jgi:hypothetical protein
MGARVKSEYPPCRPSDTAWESYPSDVPPTHAVRPSPALCGSCAGRTVSTPRHGAAHSRTASTSHPSKEDSGTLKRHMAAYCAPAWDGGETLGPQGASPPSLPALCSHPRHCAAIPGTTASSAALWEPEMMGHHRTRRCTSSDPPSARRSSRRTDGDQTRSSRTITLEAAPGQSQDSPRHLPEARFSRTTIKSTTLCAMPPYVAI